jgi:hypothetical protein
VTLQDERTWLRYRVIRMRTALRFAMSPEVTNILRELIADGEARLLALDDQANEFPEVKTRLPSSHSN